MRRDHAPSLSVQVEAVHIVAGVVVRCASKYVELAIKRNHCVTIATCWGRGTTSQDVLGAYTSPGGGLEVELKERVVLLCPGLTGKDKHAISCDSNWEVAAGGRTFPCLDHFLPLPATALPSSHQVDRPHVVEPRIAVVPCKDPQLSVVDRSAMGTSRDWLPTGWHPLGPLTSGKLVFPQVIPNGRLSSNTYFVYCNSLIPKIGVTVYVARVTWT